MNFLQVAEQISKRVHHGQRLKYVPNVVYFNGHIKPVAARMWTDEQKALAFLHDVPEQYVSNEKEHRKKTGLPPLTQAEEEALIEKSFADIITACHRNNIPMTRDDPFIQDLDCITKRTWEKGTALYRNRMIKYAKATGRTNVITVKWADLEDNANPARNLSLNLQTDKDRTRLGGYKIFLREFDIEFPRKEYPHIRPRPINAEKQQPKHGNPNRSSRGRQMLAVKQARRARKKYSDGYTPPF